MEATSHCFDLTTDQVDGWLVCRMCEGVSLVSRELGDFWRCHGMDCEASALLMTAEALAIQSRSEPAHVRGIEEMLLDLAEQALGALGPPVVEGVGELMQREGDEAVTGPPGWDQVL